MLDGFLIQLPNGKYFKTAKSSTLDVTKAKIYQSLGTMFKYAIVPNFVHNDMIDGGIRLFQIKENDDNISVVDLGEVWTCYYLYNIGFDVSRATMLDKGRIMKGMQCLADNEVEKSECAIVLQALCAILFDTDIEDVCTFSQKEWDGKTLH